MILAPKAAFDVSSFFADGYVDATQMDPTEVQRISLQARQVGGELLESFEALCAPKRVRETSHKRLPCRTSHIGAVFLFLARMSLGR